MCLSNIEVGPVQTVADRLRRRGAEGARRGAAGYFNQVLSRSAAAAMSSVDPAKEKRTKRRPS